jgi:DNA-binding GntR family transcriptional regulator
LSLPEASTVAELIEEHAAILDALEAGDAPGGRGLLSWHARRVLDYGAALQSAHPEMFTPVTAS